MKFTENDLIKYSLIISKEEKPCIICKENTRFIEFCCEGRLCSKECHDKFYDIVSAQE